MRLSHFVSGSRAWRRASRRSRRRRATTLVSADASTSLMAGERLRAEYVTHARSAAAIRSSSSRCATAMDAALAFDQANHTPNDLAAQAPGGPLAQIMGSVRRGSADALPRAPTANIAARRSCAAPRALPASASTSAATAACRSSALKQEIQFETRPDGQTRGRALQSRPGLRAPALHQGLSTMTVYALAQLNIHDRERYDRYMARFMPVLREVQRPPARRRRRRRACSKANGGTATRSC